MDYFITGSTGWIGRYLVERLLARDGARLWLLVRPATARRDAERLDGWRARGEVEVLEGDLTAPGLGLDEDAAAGVRFDHVFHLAAIYDLTATEEALERANVGGTEALLRWLRGRGFAGVLHHVSSVAVAGDLSGTLEEDALDPAWKHPHPYQRSKFRSEQLVRQVEDLRWRIYRPSAVVGDSVTGVMHRPDGPYFMFGMVRKLRDALPRWFPLMSTRRGALNMVPVDFVADALDAIAHQADGDGKCFHLVDGDAPSIRGTFNLLADAAGAPRMVRTLRAGLLKSLAPGLGQMVGQLGAVSFLRDALLEDLGVPPAAWRAMNLEVRLSTTNLDAALEDTGIRCPPQSAYLTQLWDYWLRNLDPERAPALTWRRAFAGRVIMITGASSGVGEALAVECARVGATVLLVARREEELRRVAERARAAGGGASIYPADLSELEACDRVVEAALAEHGRVDVLVNNAAHSIRRPAERSLERFHDFERVMRLNFFAAVRLMRGLIPGMRERGSGHVVNVLTAGVALPTPYFGAYGATKAALHHLTDTMAAELLTDGIHFTGVYLPWVRTPMMDATGKYKETRAMTPTRAAHWIMSGVAAKKRRVMDGETIRRGVLNYLAPGAMTRILNLLYRIYADDPAEHPEVAVDRMLLGRFIKGRLM